MASSISDVVYTLGVRARGRGEVSPPDRSLRAIFGRVLLSPSVAVDTGYVAALAVQVRDDVLARERVMLGVRWIAVVWGAFQIVGEDTPFPPGIELAAGATVAVLAAGNFVIWRLGRRLTGVGATRRLALASLAFDTAVVTAFIWLYTFDHGSSIWILSFLLPAEGALRFGMRGALSASAVVAVSYTAREVWGSGAYGYEFSLTSVTFRMGVLLLLALVVGGLARELDRQKEDLRLALDEVRKVEQWRGRLVEVLAHDIRSPLAAIESSVRLLEARLGQLDGKTAAALLQAAARQSARVQMLARDLLDLAQLEHGQLVVRADDVDVRGLVERSVAVADAAGVVEVAVEGSPRVRGDVARLEQALVNLVLNATRHGRPPVSVRAAVAGDEVVLEVRDRGEGVPPERVPDLFEAFSGSGGGQSIGLGLWIVRALVEAHGGRIGYRRDDDETVFAVRLPAGDAPVLAPVVASEASDG